MPRFLMVARDDNAAFASLGPAETQAVIQKYIAWSQGLRASGNLQLGEKLRDGEGRVVSRRNGKLHVTDGPFVETKEILGGFWLLEASSYDQARQMAESCPHLQFGSLEIRAIEELDRSS
ncbi:MAG TPA: YciI family protein [Gemmatimonadales bacterium]